MNLQDPSPGIVFDFPPTGGSVDEAAQNVANTLNECGAIASQFDSFIKGSIAECLRDCGLVAGECESCVVGKVNAAIDNATLVSQNCHSKILSHASELLMSAMTKASEAIGYQYEPLPTVVTQNEMGIFPTVGPLTKIPLGGPTPAIVLPPTALPPMPQIGPFPPIAGDPSPLNRSGRVPCQPNSDTGYRSDQPACCIYETPGHTRQWYYDWDARTNEYVGENGERISGTRNNDICGKTGIPPTPISSWPPIPIPTPIPIPLPIPTIQPPIVIPCCPEPPKEELVKGQVDHFVAVETIYSKWNSLACPPDNDAKLEFDFANSIPYISGKVGFDLIKDGNGGFKYKYPKGWLGLTEDSDLKPWQQVFWYITYGFEVLLPGISLSVLPSVGNCPMGLIAPSLINVGIIEFIEKWVGIDLTNLKQGDKYEINRQCPSHIPGQGEVDDMFMQSLIDEPLWRCWTRANNNLELPAARNVKAKRPDLSFDEAYRYDYLIGEQGNVAQIDSLLKQRYTLEFLPIFQKLKERIPHTEEIADYVTQQVDDAATVDRYKLGYYYDDFVTPEFVRYHQSQGLTEQFLERSWAAHWKTPDTQTVQSMVWRSRPGGSNWPADVEPVTEVDLEYVKRLSQFAPFWNDKMTAVSRPILEFRQLHNAYLQGQATVPDILNSLLDNGYSQRNAEIITASVTNAVDETFNFLNWKEIANDFAMGDIGRQEAFDEMFKLPNTPLLNTDRINMILDQAEWKRRVRIRHLLVKAAEVRYNNGDIDVTTAVALLVHAGMMSDEAIATVDTWKVAQKAQPKEVAAQQLCSWYGNNLISLEEYERRLVQLKWAKPDIERIIAACKIGIEKKIKPTKPTRTKVEKIVTVEKILPKAVPPVTTDVVTETETINLGE